MGEIWEKYGRSGGERAKAGGGDVYGKGLLLWAGKGCADVAGIGTEVVVDDGIEAFVLE